MKENDISGLVIDRAVHIHQALGPGLLESVYRKVLGHESVKRGLDVVHEAPVGINWEGVAIDLAFRADLIVNQLVVIELKSVEKLDRVHKKQLLTYLRLTRLRLGLILNFGEEYMKDGIVRVVNGLPNS